MLITPLHGYILATPAEQLKSIETEVAEASGLKGFLVVDNKVGRSDAAITGKTRVRLFKIREVYDGCSELLHSYIGKKIYAVCFENEKENDIIVDKDTSEKIFILSENALLAELKE